MNFNDREAITIYGGIRLSHTCNIDYVNTRDIYRYVNMRLVYVNMQHNNVDMHHNLVNMQHNQVNMRDEYVAY